MAFEDKRSNQGKIDKTKRKNVQVLAKANALKPKAIIAGPPKTQQSKNFIFIFSLIILM